jgi:hypothetical protein
MFMKLFVGDGPFGLEEPTEAEIEWRRRTVEVVGCSLR